MKPLVKVNPATEVSIAAQGKTRAGIAAKASKTARFQTLEEAPVAHRILVFGHSASGKTYNIVAFLLLGMKVFVLSTDLGGSGLVTVRNELVRIGRPELMANLLFVHWDEEEAYDSVDDFLSAPEEFGPVYNGFEPDVHVWDGFTGFQMGPIEDMICGESAISELQFDIPTWGKIKRATLKQLRRFMALKTPTGRAAHKYVTCLESKPRENDLTGETRRGPLIQGTAGSLTEAMFDVIIRVRRKVLASGEERRVFECIGNEKIAAKSRGYGLLKEEEADMMKLWRKIEAGPLGEAKEA